MRAIIGAAAFMTLTSVGSLAQEAATDTARYLLPGCKAAVAAMGRSLDRGSDDRRWRMTAGRCVGIVEGLDYLVSQLPADTVSCRPGYVSKLEMIRVVITYIEKQPQRGSEDFRKISVEAFRHAWPCPSPTPLIGVQ
jgi:hypothetical protein